MSACGCPHPLKGAHSYAHHHHHQQQQQLGGISARRAGRGAPRACRASPAQVVLAQQQQQDEAPPLHIERFGFRPGFDFEFDRGPMIGSGSFGVVHVARHIKTGQKYAVKSIPKRFGGEGYELEPEFAKRIFHEVDVARHMGQSLNVIHLVEAFEDDVHVDLVLELASGGSLWSRIQHGAVEEGEAARIIADVLRAVAQCHAKGVILRDVKPDNFLFMSRRPSSPLKMVDFGLAEFCRPGQDLSERAGTPYYVAPEVLTQSYSFPADVWSAGVTAYQLLAGRLPWANDPEWVGEVADATRMSGLGASTVAHLVGPGGPNIPSGVLWRAIMSADLDFTWPPWDDISGGARDLVAAMLTRDPGQRPTAAELLHHPWLAGTADCRTCWSASTSSSSSSTSGTSGTSGGSSRAGAANGGGGADCNACATHAMGAGRAAAGSNGGNGRGGGQQQQQQLHVVGGNGSSALLPSAAAAAAVGADAAAPGGGAAGSNDPGGGGGVVPLYLQPLEDSLVQRLQRYGTFSRLKQVALRAIVGAMSPQPQPPCLAVYVSHFATLLEEASGGGQQGGGGGGVGGTLPASRLVELLSSDVWDLSEVEVNMLVAQFDLDHDGCVDLAEWLSALIDWTLAQQHPQWGTWLRQVFDGFDTDGDGVISTRELLASLQGPAHAGWSELDGVVDHVTLGPDYVIPDAVRCVLRHADTNGDGVLSFEEFAALVQTDANDQLDLFPSRRCADGQPALLHVAPAAAVEAAAASLQATTSAV